MQSKPQGSVEDGCSQRQAVSWHFQPHSDPPVLIWGELTFPFILGEDIASTRNSHLQGHRFNLKHLGCARQALERGQRCDKALILH